MARFFLEVLTLPLSGEVAIFGDDALHISKVLRLKEGDYIEVVIENQAYPAQITQAGRNEVLAFVSGPPLPSRESPIKVRLYQGLTKGDKFDWVIQKATELGVTSVTPLLTERVVVRLDADGIAKRLERWQRIALEAAKQCCRETVPHITPPMSLSALPPPAAGQLALLAWEEEHRPLGPILRSWSTKEVSVLIGPEGGLSPEEVHPLLERGWQSVGLGPRILRTETAPLAILAILQYELGDLGGY